MYRSRPELLMLGYGSRSYDALHVVRAVVAYVRPEFIIHGDCETGADAMLKAVADEWGIQQIILPAAWRGPKGNGAGPYRNTLMQELSTQWKDYLGGVLVGCGFRVDPITPGTKDMRGKCAALVREGQMVASLCHPTERWERELAWRGLERAIQDQYRD